MPQKIITLSKELANQIAAWEVVERPVSVVKELVENSIDAGASQIDIILEEGGKKYISVRDNGAGIAWEDLWKALEKYSTSKIKNLDDLYSVMSFGFRGEALASISSVSNFTLSSQPKNQIAGRSISFQNGVKKEGEKAMNQGTEIVVEDLFYNTPARLNYLKTDRTEYMKIQIFLEQIALAYPEVALSVTHNDKSTLRFSGSMTLSERIHEVYGWDFFENKIEVTHEFWGMKVHGYITDPKISFSHKNYQSLFVNKRAIKSPMISKAIFDAYNRFIAPKTQAGYVLFLDLDPREVDVNVHPRKLEVRFAWEQNVYRSFYHGIKNELERVSLVASNLPLSENSSIPLNKGEYERQWTSTIIKNTPKYHTSSGTKFKNYSPYTDTTPNPAQSWLNFNKAVLWKEEKWWIDSGDIRDTPLGRIIGQVHNAYIVVETPEWIQILDQHAVAERVIYEKISHAAYSPKVQQLLWGISLHLTSSQLASLYEYEEIFQHLWFEIEILSHGNIMISSVPDFTGKTKIEKLFENILSDISELWSKSLDEVRHKIWAYTACRSAIKFWDPLSMFEMHALLRDASTDYSATCPHGRPVVYDIDLEELKGKYER